MNTGFIFPGQGSQSVGMLDALQHLYPDDVNKFFDNASEIVQFDLWSLIHDGPVEQLNQTEFTQVAMLASDVFIFQLVQQYVPELQPSVMAGHSLGEYAALVCAEAMTFEDGIRTVRRRGQLMQESIPLGAGAMAAIVGLSDEVVASICLDSSGEQNIVSPANFNAPGQVVIAGHTRAVEKAIEKALAQNARLATMIPVSVPCHCHLLETAAKDFESYLQTINLSLPKVPVFANINAKPYDSIDNIVIWLTSQLYSPVQWVDSIQAMNRQFSLTQCYEIGPGKVLCGLLKRIDRSIKPYSALQILLER